MQSNKLWHEMPTSEKLDWLHDAFQHFVATANANAQKSDVRHGELVARIAAVGAEVRTVATATEDRD